MYSVHNVYGRLISKKNLKKLIMLSLFQSVLMPKHMYEINNS